MVGGAPVRRTDITGTDIRASCLAVREDTVRRWPRASQEERPRLAYGTLVLASSPQSGEKHTAAVSGARSVVLCQQPRLRHEGNSNRHS